MPMLIYMLLALSSTPVPDFCDALEAAEVHERGETDTQCGPAHVCAFVTTSVEPGAGTADTYEECVPKKCAKPGELIESDDVDACISK